MLPVPSLPGLERLLQVCDAKGLFVSQEPPVPPALVAGTLIAGQPVDTLLAAVHARVGFIGIKEEFFLLRIKDEQKFDVGRVNEDWRRDWPDPFRSLLVFAKEDRLAYYYATVPCLADGRAVQPVVKVDVYEEPYALPVASDIDRFFDTYSRYLEALVASPFYEEDGPAALTFPWDVPEFIARDLPLMEMLRAGRFDFLMEKNADAREWVSQVVGASVRR